jgi:hypothetical protein
VQTKFQKPTKAKIFLSLFTAMTYANSCLGPIRFFAPQAQVHLIVEGHIGPRDYLVLICHVLRTETHHTQPKTQLLDAH